jgi:type II secretory pathway pseudopilin PulG
VNLSPFVFLVIIATIISIMGRQIARSSSYRQRGDTIVEVLIAVVIIATILGGAFVVAQSSSHMVRSSQEHGYALQQIQGQLESVRSLAFQSPSPLKDSAASSPFCLYIDTSDNAIHFANPPDKRCAGNDPLYNVTVTKGATASDAAGLTSFKVDVAWDKLGGGTSHESLVYGVKLN